MVLNKRTKRLVFVIFGCLFCLNLLAGIAVYDLSRPQLLEVVFFNVGQGDAIFIETSEKHQILIDGGPGSIILEKLAKELPFYDRSLDLVILTHPEKDHLAGLIEVLKSYKINKILWTGIVRDTFEWQKWEDLIKKEGAQIKIAKAGQRMILKETDTPIFFDILYPFESLEGQEFKDSNETSIVGRLVLGTDSFLFTGDIGESTERKLIDKNINSDVLKIAHHGSKYSSSGEFLEKVSPEIAAIQVGKNSYGHPHPEVLAKLKQFGIQVLRTDKDGDIKIVSDANNFKVLNPKSAGRKAGSP